MPVSFYPEGTTVLASDNELRTLHKIAALQASGGSGSGSQEIYLNRDPAAPDDPTKPAASFNTTTQVVTWWTGAAWQ